MTDLALAAFIGLAFAAITWLWVGFSFVGALVLGVLLFALLTGALYPWMHRRLDGSGKAAVAGCLVVMAIVVWVGVA